MKRFAACTIVALTLAAATASAGPLPWSYWVRFNAPGDATGILLGNEILPPDTDGGAGTPYLVTLPTGPGNTGRTSINFETPTGPTSLFSFGYGGWETVETLPAGTTYSPGIFALSWGFQDGAESVTGSTTGHISASGVFTTRTGNFWVDLDHAEQVDLGGRGATLRFLGVNGDETSRIEMTVIPDDSPVSTPEPGTLALGGIGLAVALAARLRRRFTRRTNTTNGAAA